MIQLTPQMRLLVALAPVDFRSGIDVTPGGTTARIMNWQSEDAEDTGDSSLEDGSAL